MKTILIIDDEPRLRQAMMDTLTYAGYETIGAGDGISGLDLIAEHHPDLIIADVLMPRLNGYDLLKHLRQDPQTQAIPVILVSGMAEYRAIQQGMALGAFEYVSKPFAVEELLSAVHAVA